MNIRVKPFYLHESQCMQVLNLLSPEDTDYLLRHPIVEIEQLESENHSTVD